MLDLVELSAMEVDTVSGGQNLGSLVGSIAVQANVNVNPQVAIAIAVLSPHALVDASNFAFSTQVNVAVVA